MIDRLGYLISSHKGYEAPLERLLSSMRNVVDDDDITIVAGGHDIPGVMLYGPILPYVAVTHNSYDYTALIDVAETPARYARWDLVFLLHDTMELGADSDRLIRQADPALDCVAVWGGECNLCLYRVDYLLSKRQAILALKDCTKLDAVTAEGFLWRQLPPDRRGVYPGGIDIEYTQPIYGGVERQRVMYTGVGITKWKANWGQVWPPNVVTP